jgi:hypothetical protein
MLTKTRANLITRSIAGETVILDGVSGKVHTLNATASCIWEACDGVRSPAEIVAQVNARFDGVPEDLLEDVLRALGEFEQLGLLTDSQHDATKFEPFGRKHAVL